jgi:hypothetical protein
MRALRLLLCSLLLSPPVWAATRYAALSGVGLAPCTTPETPCALALARQQLVSGDTLDLRAGTYDAAITNSLPSGTAETPTIVQGHAGEAWPVLRPTTGPRPLLLTSKAWIILQRLVFDAGGVPRESPTRDAVKLDGTSHHLTLQDVRLQGSWTNGLYVGAQTSQVTLRRATATGNGRDPTPTTSSYPGHGLYWSGDDGLIEQVEAADNAGLGLQLYHHTTDAPQPWRGTIRDSRFVRNGASGLAVNADQALIEHNLIADNGLRFLSAGLKLLRPGQGTVVRGNTVIQQHQGAGLIAQQDGAVLQDNISVGHAGVPLLVSGAGVVVERNVTTGGAPLLARPGE